MVTARDITLCSKEFQERHPQLYHYTSRAGLEGIVGSRTMRATDYRSLNDSSEIIHLKKSFTASLVPRFRSIIEQRNPNRKWRRSFEATGGCEKLARDFVNSVYQATFESAGGFTFVEAFIACFCTHVDDRPYVREHGLLSQWRGYSGGDGFCTVFDTPSLCQLLAKEFDKYYWVYLQADPVRYAVDEIPLGDLFPELLQAGAKTLEDFLSGIRTPEMGILEFLTGATLFKHQGFFEEQEVRIVAIPGTQALHDQGKREHADFPDLPLANILTHPDSGRRYIPLFDESGAQLPIVRVIVGPSQNQTANAEFARSVVGAAIPITCSDTPWLPPH